MKDTPAYWLTAPPPGEQARYPMMKLASDDLPVIHAYSLPVLYAEVSLTAVVGAYPVRRRKAAPSQAQYPYRRCPARPQQVGSPERHSEH